MNLSLYAVTAFVVLDTDGNRVLAKYYPGAPRPDGTRPPPHPPALREQRTMEKGLFAKTKKAGSDIILYDGQLVVYKHSLDLIFYFLGGAAENELMLQAALSAFHDAASMLLRNQVEKRALLENLDLVLLCLDETVDEGIIIETDATAIASRVSRPKTDPTDITINEETIMSAFNTVRDRIQQRMGSL